MSLVVPLKEIFGDESRLLAKHDSWQRVELGAVCQVVNGFPFKSSLFNRTKGFPIVRIRDLSKGITSTFYDGDVPDEVVVTDGDLLVGMDGIFSCWEWRGGKAGLNQRVCKIIPNERYLDRKFLFFGINGYLTAIQDATSSVTVGHLSSLDILRIPFPLPPLTEQRRIAAKLGKLLEKVDLCQRRLAKIPVLLKRFRQAVLAAACSGRLTEDWREENVTRESAEDLLNYIAQRRNERWQFERAGRVRNAKLTRYCEPVPPTNEFEFAYPESWQLASMDALTQAITSGSRDWKKYYCDDGPGTFVMAQNVRPMKFDRSFRVAVDPPQESQDRVRSEVKKNDILVTIVGANTGDVCRVPVELHEHYVCQSVALMRPVLVETSPFIVLFLNSFGHGQRQYRKWIYGEGRPHLSFDQLRMTAIAVPPLAEQQEIVRRVDELFSLADQIETRYAKGKKHVDSLKQSILAKAFSGELVPQDPNDEPAAALLKRIQTARPTRQPDRLRRRVNNSGLSST